MMRIRIKDAKLNVDLSELLMNNDEFEEFENDFQNLMEKGSSHNKPKLDQTFTHHYKYFNNKTPFDTEKAQVIIYNLLKSYGLKIDSEIMIDVEPYKISIGCDDIIEAVEILEILKAQFVISYYGVNANNQNPILDSQIQIFIIEVDKYDYDVVILNKVGDVEDEYKEYQESRYKSFPDEKENGLKETIALLNSKLSGLIKPLNQMKDFVEYCSKFEKLPEE